MSADGMEQVQVTVRPFDGFGSTARIEVGGATYEVGVRSRTQIRNPKHLGDTWALFGLLAAMRSGADLHVDSPMSPELSESLPRAQTILASWYPELRSVRVIAPSGRARRFRRRRPTAQLFTGGVDSFASLARHPEVSSLLYVHDRVHDTPEVRERVHEVLTSASRRSGRKLIEFDYDVRTFLDEFAEWGTQSHGLALAAVAALTSSEYSTVVVPATRTYRDLIPWGSHPLLDPLLGSSGQQILHDGAELTRYDKIAMLASDPTALQHLRVCWQAVGRLNCSVCEKCLRTMAALDILGVLHEASTFPDHLDLVALAGMGIPTDSSLLFTIENRDAAVRAGRMDIARSLDDAIAAYRSNPLRPP